MAAPSEREQYSTLEVATDSHLLNQGNGLEVVPPSIPEAYGYYDPVKHGHVATQPENDKLLPATVQTSIAPSTPAYSTYPEVAEQGAKEAGVGAAAAGAGAGGSKGAKICGLPRKWFWLRHSSALSCGSKDKTSQPSESTGGSGSDADGNGNAGQGSSGSGKAGVYEQSRLASANFTDAYGYDNYLVVYQLKDATLRLSAFNSSNNEWIGSNIINGTNNAILLGTALAMDTFYQGSSSPDVNLYYQTEGSVTAIQSLTYSTENNISTTSRVPTKYWDSVDTVSGFNSMPGSNLAAYGKQCDYCNQYAYFFWQREQGLYIAEKSGDDFNDAELIDITEEPSANTSIAATYSGTWNGDEDAILRRSLNLFYRSTTSGLTQLRIGNGAFTPQYVGRDIGPSTNFAAFTTGWNESDSDNPTPLGFQVLSIDPDDDDGVQLTYLKDSEWNIPTDPVDDLSDCVTHAMMAVNTGRRLYCLVDSDDAGVDIMEYAWQGDPSDTSTYLDWKKIGAVDITLD
ncbi:hypothetical protein NPX13_g4637 [Xylaria arbuscula]|uniref:Fucose-specific lectin n=1 Tax=Xylaria arbuscula TaxID=114810 RepID=A0A9W8NFX1_9PEZI|nr:hypothetical protein NPX13_g4637 [Xylaria arbuscula]